VRQLDVAETKPDDFLNHRLAIMMAAVVPAG
jgi:hypothetical protein